MKNKNLSGDLFAAEFPLSPPPPPPAARAQTSISRAVAEYLRARGIYSERLSGGKIKTPDRLAIVRGQAIFIETRIPSGKLSPEQTKNHDRLRAAGALVVVAATNGEFIKTFNAIRAAIEQARKGEINLYD